MFFAIERSALGHVEKGNCDEDEDVPAAAGASFNVRWRFSVRERERLSKRRACRSGAIGGKAENGFREVPERRRIAAPVVAMPRLVRCSSCAGDATTGLLDVALAEPGSMEFAALHSGIPFCHGCASASCCGFARAVPTVSTRFCDWRSATETWLPERCSARLQVAEPLGG